MAVKYKTILTLADDTSKEIVSSKQSWCQFLTTASRFYKYPFMDQLLIYAQRPSATACASIETWNKKMNCWVNKGAKGIALLDDDTDKLKYVFDISDVHQARYIGKTPYIWELRKEEHPLVLEHLNKMYKDVPGTSLEEKVFHVADKIALDSYGEYVGDLKYLIQGSFLEELDDLNLAVGFRNLLSSSIAYTLFCRCNLDIQEYSQEFNFEYISEFNTTKVLSQLGNATTSLSKQILLEIGKTITVLHNHTKANEPQSLQAEEANILGGKEYGISEERRLLHTQYSDGRAARGNVDQAWPTEEEIPEGEQEGSIRWASDVKRVEEASSGDTGRSRKYDDNFNTADGSIRRDNRNIERGQPNALDTEHEQYPEQSRGNRPAGVNLQLSLFPSMDEQIGDILINNADNKFLIDTSSMISDEIVQKVILTGGGTENSRLRIFAKYQRNKSSEEIVEFLKKEYSTGGKGFTLNNNPTSVWYDNEGMKISYGNSAQYSPIRFLTWEEVEKFTSQIIHSGEYMTEEEIKRASILEKDELSSKIYFFFRDERGIIVHELGMTHTVPNSIECLKEHLSTHEGIDKILYHMDLAMEELDNGSVEPKYSLIYRPEDIRKDILDLKKVPIEFPQKIANVEIPLETFITQDEIDFLLSRGSNVSGGLFRIYDYFHKTEDKKELVDFLKSEYGTGGQSSALPGDDSSWENHDFKGIVITKGNLAAPKVETLITWNKVVERIQKLIATNRFLTSDIKKQYFEWKDQNNAEALQKTENKLKQKKSIQEDLPEEGFDISEKALEQPLKFSEKFSKKEDAVEIKENDYAVKAVNYRIENDNLGVGSAKEKFKSNINAVKTLQQIEKGKRLATPAEQQILSQYVGWGSLADVFDINKANWSSEYQELKELLSPEEYSLARSSTLNAHYTSPTILRNVFNTIDRLGFKQGNILDPALGIGNFFGMLPDKMKDSKLYGVEIDSITGRIAKQLYPNANVKVTGFEKTDFPNDFFDVAVGNVPFGQYKVLDKVLDKHNFLIHDYFFAKTLDKVRPGGIIAFITSKGTLDKKNPAARKYIAERAEFLGAVRLPNTAFLANAGTEVTSDILFLQKRDRPIVCDEGWMHTAEKDGITMNEYFIEHPEMILGTMELVSGPFGMESTCKPNQKEPFEEQLQKALYNIRGTFESIQIQDLDEALAMIPADPNVKNYSYTIVDDMVYYRENSIMVPMNFPDKAIERIKGMVSLRSCTQELITYQLEEYSNEEIRDKQLELNHLYDDFIEKNGLINSSANKRVFHQDSSYCLLCSLEVLNEDGTLKRKADMFTKRTIKKQEVITKVDTASEALTVSLSEKAKVDLEFMSQLCQKPVDSMTKDLSGVIFKNPATNQWETSDEYLSGNVREKLIIAKEISEHKSEFFINVSALEKVQPVPLEAADIEVRLGATWIDPKYISDFMRDVFKTPSKFFNNNIIDVQYSDATGQWNIKGKNADSGNAIPYFTYGTKRVNGYKLLEDSLNLRDIRIFDIKYDNGVEKRELNKQETTIARQKQDSIKESFKNWIFAEQERRQTLCNKYNELFNSSRPREYDGGHLTFPGMTPDIILKPHQKNAVAHVIYGNNTLLAHCVGAGKTFEMVASAMESKRLGLCQKSLFVVPNHLTEQWASDFLRLYPGANILAATKKDFEPSNRKKFCSRIATGDYDAVIIGHSQFEKIPLSAERQQATIEKQINEITMEISSLKANNGERYTIKQMEKTKKSLEVRLSRLNDQEKKDDVITFEQLGVDRLFVDESHSYKNLFLYTKMRNVSGIAQTEAQKSSDMFAKCQYLDELTGGKGITFATGTPISNSMTELYTNMRYLQFSTLQKLGLGHFDSWASAFGETVTAIELAPEGTGYRAKTRFANFFNLPELIHIFKEAADIQTPDMLKLPVPEVEYHNVVLKPSIYQKKMVENLAERAEDIRNKKVEPNIDNMLKVTNDGRKLALEQRLLNEKLPDDENSKVNTCVQNVYDIWLQNMDTKATQLIFCDLSTPKGDGFFNVYEDIKQKLILRGIPEKEVAFIHDANTELKKAELFSKVRSGKVRILLGSTSKMGAGTNVQDKLIALHHLDVPWRPSDIEQQEGRILRQGNTNKKVQIFRYVTEGTFDSYSWQLIESKQKFIGQIMTSKSPVRSCEDIDATALTYAEVKALATGNPHIKEKMDLDIQVSKLNILKSNHLSQKYRLEDNITKHYPLQIALLKENINGYMADIALYQKYKPKDDSIFTMKLQGITYTNKKDAGAALIHMCKQRMTDDLSVKEFASIGEYSGFQLLTKFDFWEGKFILSLKGNSSHNTLLSTDPIGNITKLNNVLEAMPEHLIEYKEKLEDVKIQLENATVEVTKEFPFEAELQEKSQRLNTLNILLSADAKDGIDKSTEKTSISEKLSEIKKETKTVNCVPVQKENCISNYER